MSLWASQYTCENKIAKVKTAFPDRATYEVGGQVCLTTGDTASELIFYLHTIVWLKAFAVRSRLVLTLQVRESTGV